MRILSRFVCLLAALFAVAQDNIVLGNGEEISATVLEVNQTTLKDRTSANQDGPVYTAPLGDVLLINYANGSKDAFGPNAGPRLTRPATSGGPDGSAVVTTPAPTTTDRLRYKGGLFRRFYSVKGNPLTRSAVNSLLYSAPGALTNLEKGRSLRIWSVATAIPALVLIGTGVGLMIEGQGGLGNDSQRRDHNPADTNTFGENGMMVSATG